MSHSTRTHGRDPLNFVHKNAILAETIKKETDNYKPYTSFSINPFKPMYTVTGKPNSFQDAELDEGKEDEVMRKVIAMSQLPPTKKFTSPQTSSQEYGWITQPLMEVDKSDIRLHHPRRMTDVTENKEAEWTLMEQSKNPS